MMLSSNLSTTSTAESQSPTPPTTPDEHEIPDTLLDFKHRPSSERFQNWRPSYHPQAPRGWMNDPCSPGHNPVTGLYHVSFQWNPYGNDWGNISWCSATSPDMLNWTVDPRPTLSPDQPYDCEGVFTGCMVHGRDGLMNYIYTSVSSLPIYHTLPHPKGCESLSLSTSYDNGRTWTKSLCNPFLLSEPASLDVTGWRDPYVARWPRMSAVLGLDAEKTLFGIVSGGIRDVTPTTFLYSVDADDLTKWEFIDPIVNFGLNKNLSRWSGDLGKNFEVTNFVNLKDETDPSVKRDFLIMGTEGCERNVPGNAEASLGPSRPSRNQLWTSVSVRKASEHVVLTNDFGGYLDYGCMYAANSFYDPHSERQVVWGWIPEDDLGDDLRHAQGWSGMLSLPRELRMQTLQNVVGACASDLSSITSIELELDNHGSHTIRTLASQPCPAVVEALRGGSNVRRKDIRRASLERTTSVNFAAEEMQSLQWELDCSFRVSKSCCSVGIRIQHCEDGTRSTTLLFSPRSETFTIHRPALRDCNSSELINSNPESVPHTLFTMRDLDTGTDSRENLDIRAWRDNSVLEVFINGRTAISTRLYAAGETCGMYFFADDNGDGDGGRDIDSFSGTELLYATLWDGIGTVSNRD